jgi:hypothetical protein
LSRTEGDFYDMNNPIPAETKMTTDYGWGFCTNECAQEKEGDDLRLTGGQHRYIYGIAPEMHNCT